MNFSYSKLALACTLALSANWAYAEGENAAAASAPTVVSESGETAQHAVTNTERLPENNQTADNPNLNAVGRALNNNGITPHLIAAYSYFTNPSSGIDTHKNEQVGMIIAGADIDLQKAGLVKGGHIHFSQMWAPYTKGLDYGDNVGSVLAGNPPPYLPKVSHLTRFTYEQRLLDDKLSIELGKSNPGNFYGKSLCTYDFACVNPVLQKVAHFSATPYAGWGVRTAYKITPQLEVSGGWWRTYQAFPFTNGWEKGWDNSRIYQDEGNVYIAGMNYKSDRSRNAYPLDVESFLMHTDHKFPHPYYGRAQMERGMTGIHVGARKVFWRKDGGNLSAPHPTTLSVYGSVSHMFNQTVYTGLKTYANAGILWSAPFANRPGDTLGLNFSAAHISRDGQRYMAERYLGNDGWQPKRNEFQVSLDATVPINRSVIFQLSAARTWNGTNWMLQHGQMHTERPKNGLSVSAGLTILLDQVMGLVDRTPPQ